MISNHKSLAGIALILAMLACSLPAVAQPTVVADQTATITAPTVGEPTDDAEVTPTVPAGVSGADDRARPRGT